MKEPIYLLANPYFLAITVMVVVLLLWKPFMAYAVFVASIPLDHFFMISENYSLSKLLGAIAAFSWFLHSVLLWQKRIRVEKITWCLFFLVALSSVGLDFSRSDILRSYLGFFQCAILVFLTLNMIESEKKFEITVAVFATVCLISFLYSFSLPSEIGLKRLALAYRNENESSFLAGGSILMLLFILENASLKILKLFYGLMSLPFFILLFFTGSKGGLISFVMALSIYILGAGLNQRFKAGITIGILLGSFLYILNIFDAKSLPENMKSLTFALERLQGLMHFDPSQIDDKRMRIWGGAFPLIVRNPIMGYGYGAFSATLGIDAHNQFLKIWFENGFLGLMLYLGIYVLSLLRIIKCARGSYFIYGISILTFCFSTNLCMSTSASKTFWLIMASCWLFDNKNVLENRQKQQNLKTSTLSSGCFKAKI